MLEINAAQQVYEFGEFKLDQVERKLFRDGESTPLAPKVFETLLVLVERSGRMIEKAELLRLAWPDTFVEVTNLAQKREKSLFASAVHAE